MIKVNKIDFALLFLRVAPGLIFTIEGYLKLFVASRAGLTVYFASLGFPIPHIVGLGIGFFEFFGGVFLIVGFLTRALGILFALEMLVATLVANAPQGFGAPVEVTTLLFFVALALGIMEGGVWSIDYFIKTLKHENTRT